MDQGTDASWLLSNNSKTAILFPEYAFTWVGTRRGFAKLETGYGGARIFLESAQPGIIPRRASFARERFGSFGPLFES